MRAADSSRAMAAVVIASERRKHVPEGGRVKPRVWLDHTLVSGMHRRVDNAA